MARVMTETAEGGSAGLYEPRGERVVLRRHCLDTRSRLWIPILMALTGS